MFQHVSTYFIYFLKITYLLLTMPSHVAQCHWTTLCFGKSKTIQVLSAAKMSKGIRKMSIESFRNSPKSISSYPQIPKKHIPWYAKFGVRVITPESRAVTPESREVTPERFFPKMLKFLV